MTGKYIIFERQGLEYTVLFPDHFVQHKEIEVGFDKPVRAGFFGISIGQSPDGLEHNIVVKVWGESTSLKLKSDSSQDIPLIQKQFNPY